jgi:hypothetical protein
MGLLRRFTKKKPQAAEVGTDSAPTETGKITSNGAASKAQVPATSTSKAQVTATSTSGTALYTTKPTTNAAQVNGTSNSISEESDEEKDHKVTRAEIEATFANFASLIHASLRPLPNQTGDGQYIEKEHTTGLLSDLKSLGYSDVKAVIHALEDAESGKLIDDRKMHMEELMQVCTDESLWCLKLMYTVGCQITRQIRAPSRPDSRTDR